MKYPSNNVATIFLFQKKKEVLSTLRFKNSRFKKVTINTDKRTRAYISGVFTRSKNDGNHRMILNLKNFNKFICYRRFKMELIENLLNLIRKDTFMVSNDPKNAFYSVSVAAHQIFKFFC